MADRKEKWSRTGRLSLLVGYSQLIVGRYMADSIEMPFELVGHVSPRNDAFNGVPAFPSHMGRS